MEGAAGCVRRFGIIDAETGRDEPGRSARGTCMIPACLMDEGVAAAVKIARGKEYESDPCR
ncbi:hypothetical protein P4K96_12160 [Bacillus cereus]|uniref:hypothetical protein n=1 Tax=Paenibacillus dendritiformis TaxID=130049 RepID=UPI001BCA97E9|nr:hypothetical protein [Paenibacillus dendritiformis]MEB9894283.1 hypothetical protein [Bacillus cereus]